MGTRRCQLAFTLSSELFDPVALGLAKSTLDHTISTTEELFGLSRKFSRATNVVSIAFIANDIRKVYRN